MAEYAKPLPVTDADSRRFWEGAKQRKLMMMRCESCGRLRWPPRDFCNWCHTPGGGWIEVSGRTTLVSWTVQHHLLHPAFSSDIPYAIVLVALEEDADCRLIGNLRDAKPEELEMGMPMAPVYEDVTDEVTLIHWKPG